MTKTTKKKVPKKKAILYKASVRVLGRVTEAKGKTILEAIGKLEPGNVNGMAILAITNGDNTKERVIPHYSARRLFNTAGMSRDIQLENVSLLFDGV